MVKVTPTLWHIQQAVGCIRSIVCVARIFGFDETGWSPVQTVRHWSQQMLNAGSWIKFAKYKLAAFYAFHTGNELPKLPDGVHDVPRHLLGGKAGRWMASFLKHSKEMERQEFLNSILQSKKGMPRPRLEELRKAEQETVKMLFSPPPALPSSRVSLIPWSDDRLSCKGPIANGQVEIGLTVAAVTEQLRRTVFEIFRDVKGNPIVYDEGAEAKLFFPSTSANYINTRSAGGAVGFFKEWLSKMDVSYTGRVDKYLWYPGSEGEEIGLGTDPILVYNTDHLQGEFRDFYSRAKAAALREQPFVAPVGLPEALKIRVITKGPPLLNSVLKPLQKFLWRTLRDRPIFKLIGQPVEERILLERLGQRLPSGKLFFSVDYKSATDNFRHFVSTAVVDAISDCCCLDDQTRQLFHRALTGHHLQLEDGTFLQQTHGQLMGSIVSFPVLCIANAAILRWISEIDDNRVYTLDLAQILVNGDDAALKLSREGMAILKEVGAYCGLELSVGKCYASSSFVNINSTCFLFRPEHGRPEMWERNGVAVARLNPWYRVRTVNMGLMTLTKRSGGKSVSYVSEDGSSLGACARALFQECPPRLWENCWRTFLRSHWDVLNRMRVPWYLPEWCGGLGLPFVLLNSKIPEHIGDRPVEFFTGKYGPSSLDLRGLRYALLNFHELGFKRFVTAKSWKLHQLVQRSLPWRLVASLQESPYQRDFDELYSSLVVGSLLNNTSRLEDLFDESPEDLSKHLLRVNEQIWRSILRKQRLPSLASVRSRLLLKCVDHQEVFTSVPALSVDFPTFRVMRARQRLDG
jgi:hypothetical protein